MLAVVGAGCTAEAELETSEVTGELALPPPTNLVADAVSPTRIILTWDASPGATRYVIYRGPSAGSETTLTSYTGTSFTSNYLTPSTQYCFRVRNVNSTNEISAYSSSVCVTTPATLNVAAPSPVSAVPSSPNRIELTWGAVTGATAYQVYGGLTSGSLAYISTVTAPTLTLSHANLTAGTSYSYYVIAVTANGNSPASVTVSTTTPNTGTEGEWKFDENGGTTAGDISGYTRTGTLANASFSTDRPPVFRRSNNSVASFTSASDSQMTVNYANGLRLTSTFTVAMWVKPTGDASYVGMRAANCGAASWVFGANAANGLYLQEGNGVRASGAQVASNQWSHVAVTGGNGTLEFFVNGVQVASMAYTPAARSVLPLTFGHVGSCAGSAVMMDEVKVQSVKMTPAQIAALGTQPPAPANLTVTNVCSKRQDLSWGAVAGAQLYYVYRGTAPGNETYYTSVAGTSTTLAAPALAVGTQYSWVVQADVADVHSPNSNEVVLTTLAAPAAPATVSAAAVNSTRASVTFSAVPAATRYFIYMSTNGGAYTYRTTVLTAGTTQIAGLTSGNTYSFVVRALDCSSTQSVDSMAASVTLP